MSMRSTRTDALIKDIAKLFVQYPPTVWRPIVDDLLAGNDMHARIAEQIASLCAQASATAERTGRRSQRKGTPKKAEPKSRKETVSTSLSFSPQRREDLEKLWAAIADRRLLPKAADIREAYIVSGGKDNLPGVRRSAMTLLFQHLDRLQDDQFQEVMEKLKGRIGVGDIDQDYKRWFNIIKKT